MPVNNERTHTTANQLIGEHQPGWAGPDDKNIRVHSGLPAVEGSSLVVSAFHCP
jgi:hypothetical protein